MKRPSGQPVYISLSQAAKLVPYSAQYLGLRARQGKLKSVKIGRDWFTTKAWLEAYATNVRAYRKTKRPSVSSLKNFYDADALANPLPDLSRLRPRISPEYHYEAVASSRSMALLLACYAVIISIFIFSPYEGAYRNFLDYGTQTLSDHARGQMIVLARSAHKSAAPLARIFVLTSEESANLARTLLASSGATAVEYASQLGSIFEIP